MFNVEKYWGFAVGFYQTTLTDLKRGDAVTLSGGDVVRASDATDKQAVYLVDYARQAQLASETFEDAEAVPSGTYLTLYNINEGCFTLDGEHFADKPATGDLLELDSDGKFQTQTSGTAVAEVIYVEGTDTEYRVTIRPAY